MRGRFIAVGMWPVVWSSEGSRTSIRRMFWGEPDGEERRVESSVKVYFLWGVELEVLEVDVDVLVADWEGGAGAVLFSRWRRRVLLLRCRRIGS